MSERKGMKQYPEWVKEQVRERIAAGETQKQLFSDSADMLLENGEDKDGDAAGDTDTALKGDKIEAKKRTGLCVTGTGSGKKKKVQFALQFGGQDTQGEYRLTASGATLHMVEEGQTKAKAAKFVRKENKTTVVICPSGTQLRCVMKASAKAEIKILCTDAEGNKVSDGRLTIRCTGGKYEAVLQ